MLVDLRKQQLTGKEAANLLREANIVSNFNTIPFDPQPPTQGSGIRPGTPSLTTRGMKEAEMQQVATFITRVLNDPKNIQLRAEIKEEVINLCRRFPIYQHLGK